MKDASLFCKLGLGYFDDPKIAELLDDSPRVIVLHVRAIVYCRAAQTDGRFSARHVARLAAASYCGCGSQCGSQCGTQCAHEAEGAGRCDVCTAVAVGLFNRDADGMHRVNSYLNWQDSPEEIKARISAGRKAAASRWSKRDAKGNADRNAKGNADRNAKGNADRNAEPNTETETETDIKTLSRAPRREVDAANASSKRPQPTVTGRFEEFWALYPKKVAKRAGEAAWKRAALRSTPDAILAGLQAQLPGMRATAAEKGLSFVPNPATWLNGDRWGDELPHAQHGPERDPWAHMPKVQRGTGVAS